MNEQTITTARGRLFAQRWPAPVPSPSPTAPVVLLHDSLGCVTLWRDFPAQLAMATGRDVIAYDRLGFGRSDPHPGPIPRDFIAAEARRDFAAVRAAFALERFVAFGHSVGGGMALGIAAEYGNRCVAAIAMAAQAFVEDRTLAGVAEAKAKFADPDVRARLRKYHGERADWVLSAWIDTWLDPAYADWNLDAELARIVSPVLAIHGGQDEYASAAHPRRIAARVGGAVEIALLPEAGHLPHRESPPQVLERVVPWLARVDP